MTDTGLQWLPVFSKYKCNSVGYRINLLTYGYTQHNQMLINIYDNVCQKWLQVHC